MEEKLFAKWGGLLETIDEADGPHESERINRIQKNIIALEKANGWEAMKTCLDALKDDRNYICSPLLDLLSQDEISILKSGSFVACKFLLEHCPEIHKKISCKKQYTNIDGLWKPVFISLEELIEFIDKDLFIYLLLKIPSPVYEDLYMRAASFGKVEIMLYLDTVCESRTFFDSHVIPYIGKYPKMLKVYIVRVVECKNRDFLFEVLGEDANEESLEIIHEKMTITEEEYNTIVFAALGNDNVDAIKFVHKYTDLKKIIDSMKGGSTYEKLGAYHTNTIIFLVDTGCFSALEATENAVIFGNMKLLQYLLQDEKKVPMTEEEIRWIFQQAFGVEFSVEIVKYLIQKFQERGVSFTEEEIMKTIENGFQAKGEEDFEWKKELLKELTEN